VARHRFGLSFTLYETTDQSGAGPPHSKSLSLCVSFVVTMSHFLNWRDFAGVNVEKFFKTTLWQGEHVMVGLNCLEPAQTQPVHAHAAADKFYFVLEGKGSFSVGEEEHTLEPGALVIAPAGIPHGVSNSGTETLSLLVAIAPGVK